MKMLDEPHFRLYVAPHESSSFMRALDDAGVVFIVEEDWAEPFMVFYFRETDQAKVDQINMDLGINITSDYGGAADTSQLKKVIVIQILGAIGLVLFLYLLSHLITFEF